MNRTSVYVVLGSLFFACASFQPTAEQLESADFGRYPDGYEQLVLEWLTTKPYRSDNRGVSVIPIQYAEMRAPIKAWRMAGKEEGTPFKFGYDVVLKYMVTSVNAPERRGNDVTNNPVPATTYEQQEYRLTLFIRDDTVAECQYEPVR